VTYQSPKLEDLELFVAVVDAGGFTAAARATGGRKALLSRRVQELEQRLGTRLLERTTRVVRLTDVGRTFYERAARAVAAGREAMQVVEQARREPTGTLRIATTQLLADLILEPVVLAYLTRHAKVAVEIDVGARPVDVVGESFDLALRVGPQKDSSLRSRALGKGRTICVASPGYLAKHGAPERPADVASHAAVIIAGGPVEWPFESRGRRLLVKPKVRLSTPSFLLARSAVCAGVGVGRLPSFFVDEALRGGALRSVLEEWTPAEVSVFALFPGRPQMPPKTRAFLDLLGQHLREHPLPIGSG
jgi:LysR family transcriptional regulator, regulator for bpeEF and oprC